MARHASRAALVALALGCARQCCGQNDFAYLRECGAENTDFVRIEGIPKGKEIVRGIVATKNIPKTSRILIPEKCAISSQMVALKTKYLRALNFTAPPGVPLSKILDIDIVTLMIYISALRLAVDKGSEEGSVAFYRDYVRLLPAIDDYRSFHPFYMDEVLEEAFESLVVVEWKRFVTEAIRQFLLPELDTINAYSREEFGVDGINLEYLYWAHVTIFSRRFHLKHRGNVLIPLYDMANSPHLTAFEDSNMIGRFTENGNFEFQATREIAAGEEITSVYDDRVSNNLFFAQYGFLRRDNPNPVPELDKAKCAALKPAFALSDDASSQRSLLANLKKLAVEACRTFKRKKQPRPQDNAGEL